VLALTDSAVEAVKHVVSSVEELPETGGLRVVAEQDGTQVNLHLSIVPSPAGEDDVIEAQGARIFLEPEASTLLDTMVLDADVDDDQIAFSFAGQPES
jgi:iron-sulfur cluster assembly protein